MSLHAVKILGISITNSSKKTILEELEKRLVDGSSKQSKTSPKDKKIITVVTPNPEQIVCARKNNHFADLLNRADVALPDGVGVVWASRFLADQPTGSDKQDHLKVIPGVEFMEELVRLSWKRGLPVALIGGRRDLAVKTFDCLSKRHPGLRGWGVDGREMKVRGSELMVHSQKEGHQEYFKNLAERIIDTGARVVFVGLGAPKQELFIEQLAHSLKFIVHSNKKQTMNHELRTMNPVIFMSVGGSFDEIFGRIPKSPKWINSLGLKWLWRLILEPWRFKRQLALVQFMWLVLKEKVRS